MFQYFVKRISCPLIVERDGLKDFFPILTSLEKSQYWGKNKIEKFQFNRLKKILIHANSHTSFYKKRFEEAGFKPETMNDPSELGKIPLLTKNDIRMNVQHMIADNYLIDQLHNSETGGTSGVKMKFYRDNACLSPKEAALYRFDKWTGWDFGERMGIVWPAQQDYIGHWTLKSRIKNELYLRQVVFPAAILNEELIDGYVKLLLKKRPTMIRAFSSPLYEIAKYIKDKGIESISMKGIVTTGEPLYEHQRQVISSAFHCDVFNSYRSREAGPMAQECEMHSGLHINAESLYIETVANEEENHTEKKHGEIVVTDLLNYGMPLIRYKMGDIGIISKVACGCGRGLPLLKEIVGRTGDFLYAGDGKKIAAGSLVLYLVDEAPGLVGQVQVIQNKINHLIIKMTTDPPPSQKIIEYQKNTVRRLFGEAMNISFEIVEKIPRGPSGKYRFAINNLNKDDEN